MLVSALHLSACGRSQPTDVEIQAYIENYQVTHDYKVALMDYDVEPSQSGDSGSIRVSGKLELRHPLYIEDLGNTEFRERVEKVLRRNRFSEREINHEIYDRVIRAMARIEGRENEYYTFLKEEYAPGYMINFSADLIYSKGANGYVLDGLVNHPKLQGSRLVKFTNPVVDDTKLVDKAVEAVLAEQARYHELMKASSAVLTKLWDNEHGLVVWNRKVPYLGDENLSASERAQLQEYTDWRGVYRISNIKPVQFNTPHASNFFELGSYTTDGIATCLRPTGFARELKHSKANFEHYCEFGKQYPIKVLLASLLNETNEFDALVEFEIGGASTGELIFQESYFQREENELARYSDRQRVVFLEQPFDLASHNRPAFRLVKSSDNKEELLRLEYTGATDYVAAGLGEIPQEELIDVSSLSQAVDETSSDAVQLSVAPTVGENNAESNKNKAIDSAPPSAETEMVKAIQTELKRLNVYTAEIDGIAGEQTYWAMDYVKKQLGDNSAVRPSQALLTQLKDTPDTAIMTPTEAERLAAEQSQEAIAEQPKKKKTLGGWFSGLFKKKDNKPKD